MFVLAPSSSWYMQLCPGRLGSHHEKHLTYVMIVMGHGLSCPKREQSGANRNKKTAANRMNKLHAILGWARPKQLALARANMPTTIASKNITYQTQND
eukprot:6486111-Amphidinium_carterae.1